MRKDLYAYPEINDWKWKSYDEHHLVSVDDFINRHLNDEFYVGTDSHVYGKHSVFTTALIAYRWGTGGNIICFTQKTMDVGALRPRLISEAMRSLTVAYYLDSKIPKKSVITIHLDVNNSIKFKSGQYKEELVGIIMAQGERFRPVWKPDSWASSKAADRMT